MIINNKCQCRHCGGELVDEYVFLDRMRIKRTIALFTITLPLLIVASPVFCIVRIIILGGFKILINNYIEILVSILPKKILIGAIVSFVLSCGLGILGKERGTFASIVIGAIAVGFFMGASRFFPLKPEGENRWDIVIVALFGGILMGMVSLFGESIINKTFKTFLAPPIKEEEKTS